MSRESRKPRVDSILDPLVQTYTQNRGLVERFRNSLVDAITGSGELMRHIHSIKSRLKDVDHLREKLNRKMEALRGAGREFDITPDNLLVRVNDLAGVRLLHLHTHQIRDIDARLRGILEEQQYGLLEGPFARTWDDESRSFFRECGIETQESPSLYTSVHYVVGSASRTTVTCEIQVRTLMEEVWGEVDHSMNYPHKVNSLACSEQLKVLARVTSSATRLVDSIFATLEDHRGADQAYHRDEVPLKLSRSRPRSPRRSRRRSRKG
jgi:putative GTP pyrophosphokinase